METGLASPSYSVYGCASPVGFELLTRSSLTAEQKQAIRSFHALDQHKNCKIAVFAALWVGCGIVFFNVQFLPVQIASMFLMGCAVSGLPILMHEACHQTLFANKSLNRWIGFVCGLPGLVAVSAYRSVHLVHHSRTRTERDPDDIEVSAGASVPKVAAYYFVLVAGIYWYIAALGVVGFRFGNAQFRKQILIEYAMMVLVYTLVCSILPVQIILYGWILPLLIAGQLSNVRGLAEHGFTNTGNEFLDSRTVVSNRFVSWMMNNLNYHLEHHLFPAVPWYNLPKLHTLLRAQFHNAGASVYGSYSEFLVDFFRTTFRQPLTANTRLIPAHVREELCL